MWRSLSSINGAIHDVARLKAMDTELCHVIGVSETTLNIIQNYAIDEIAFLSRFGVEFSGGEYVPVDSSNPDFDFVLDVMRRYRLEVNDLTCDLVGAINALTVVLNQSMQISCGCEIGQDSDAEDGQEGGGLPDPIGGIAYEAADPITDRKCIAANYIHDQVRDVIEELNLKRVDDYAYFGLVALIPIITGIIGGIAFPPFGILIGLVAGGMIDLALGLWKVSFDLGVLEAAILADEAGAVCALFNSTSAAAGRDAYASHLIAEGATSAETAAVAYLMPNSVMNLLFFAWGDSEATLSAYTPTIDCSTCPPPPCALRPIFVNGVDHGSGDYTKDESDRTLSSVQDPVTLLHYISIVVGDYYELGWNCADLESVCPDDENAQLWVISYSGYTFAGHSVNGLCEDGISITPEITGSGLPNPVGSWARTTIIEWASSTAWTMDCKLRNTP